MQTSHDHPHPTLRFEWHPALAARVVWTVLSVGVVESVVFGLSVVPAVFCFELVFGIEYPNRFVAVTVLSIAFIPIYVVFATFLMVLSALSTRLTGWRTPAHAEMRIAALEWPILRWARYMVSVHIVRLFAGSLLRATPLWTFYLRLNGAHLGKGVYVNSLMVNDHNLLEFDEHVIIGDDVHLSGHTVEHGLVKTAPVRLGRGVMVGLGSVVGIGVEAGDGCQIGALSLVPKFTKLDAGATYVGSPVHKV